VRIYRTVAEAAGFGPSALTIGNFDGVHDGHRRILRRVREVAEAGGWKASVLTFDPHPTRVVAPERAPRLMTSPEQRAALMAGEGIEQALILPFTEEVAHWTPDEFVRGLLVERLGARAVLVGANFRFGHHQAGDTAVLAALGRQYGFTVEVVPAVLLHGRLVSSSGIRHLIRTGQVARAARGLHRPYSLEGEVVPGRGVGSSQTVPTLNLATTAEVLPAPGVYVTRTFDLEGRREWQSVTNVGFRPTFGDDPNLSIETFLLAWMESPAPRAIRVEFLHRLREERRFPTPEALRAQILVDVRRAQTWFRRARRWALH
jgi:riboflavin kinase/FMN adenylyltransferase